MLKRRAFTIIEVLTAITIMAIVATITVPEYWRWRDRDQYRSEGQAFFDTLLDVRNAALTNKFCSNGNTSYRWRVLLNSNATPPRYRVHCYWDETTNNVAEGDLVLMNNNEIELIDFNDASPPGAMVPGGLPDNVQISFFSGSASGRLDYSDGSLNREEEVKIVFGHDDSAYENAICFNRVAGFPTFNKTGRTCLDY